jgi:hypothetical protein
VSPSKPQLILQKVRTVRLSLDSYKTEASTIDQQVQLLIHHAQAADMIAKDIDQIQSQPGSRYQDYAEVEAFETHLH